VFYGVIVAGVLLGLALAVFGGWRYLEAGDRKPTGRRTLDGAAEVVVIPVCAMIGATFGGLAGFATAAVWERRRTRWVRR
jgi:NhaP-type Na+/H+ or K+/H+ antiporter